jgi:hypothetical protein
VDTDKMVALATEFAEIAAAVPNEGQDLAIRRIVQRAVLEIDGCDWASITEIIKGEGHSRGSSDPVAAEIDQLQHKLGEGPCMDAAWEDSTHLMFQLAGESRWPNFVSRALEETPLQCVLALRLPGGNSAALNLYAGKPDAFDEDAITSASIFAGLATGLVVLNNSQQQSRNLESALTSNRQIGTAMGILMARHKVTEDQAFTMLRVSSQNLHRKLRDVAADVTETGTLPDLPAN